MMKTHKYWDLGEYDIVKPSQKSLYKIMNGLILCQGKLHSSYSLEIRDGQWQHDARSCAVCFRISLPVGEEVRFKELTGFELTEPPQVHLN